MLGGKFAEAFDSDSGRSGTLDRLMETMMSLSNINVYVVTSLVPWKAI
jgi:hypothetical protein